MFFKIEFQVRRDNFPLIRSDWFLDRIIVERNRDSVKFTFYCHCWLRTEQPNVTISVFSGISMNQRQYFHQLFLDSLPINKTNASTNTQINVIVILSISVGLITCFICCIHQFCRTRNYQSIYIEQESPVIERYYPPSAPPPRLYDQITPPETIQCPLLLVNTIVHSTDEPPAYRGANF
jgi:hypothetical protein